MKTIFRIIKSMTSLIVMFILLTGIVFGQSVYTGTTSPVKYEKEVVVKHRDKLPPTGGSKSNPANDSCQSAILLTQQSSCNPTAAFVGTLEVNMIACTGESVQSGDDDVWFVFMATDVSAKVTVTPSMWFDAVIEVHEGTCGSLSGIACEDMAADGGEETAILNSLTPGNMYYVRVYDYYDGMPPTTTFDICVTDIPHCVNSYPGSTPEFEPCGADVNGGCNMGTPSYNDLVLGQSVTGNAWADGGLRDTDWYRFRLDDTVTVDIDVAAEFPFVIYVLEDDSCNFLPLVDSAVGNACDSANFNALMFPGDYIMFFAPSVYAGYACATTNFYSFNISTIGQDNDDCSDAIAVACGETHSGTTNGATLSGVATCGGLNEEAPGVWYVLTGGGQNVTASLCTNTFYDSRLFIFEGICGSLSCVDADDDYCGDYSEVTWYAASGMDYYIYVSGTSGATGNFELDITCGCGVPKNIIQTSNTLTTADLSWEQPGGAISWQMEYDDLYTFVATGVPTFPSITNPYTVNGLDENSDYYFNLRAVCAVGDTSPWVGPFVMNTFCPEVYSQSMGTYGDMIPSTKVPIMPIMNCELADDFVVPGSDCWEIERLRVSMFTDGVDSMNVYIYDDAGGYPGTKLYTFNDVYYIGYPTGTHLTVATMDAEIYLASPIYLCGGGAGTTYWISVQGIGINGSYIEITDDAVIGEEPQFRNPGGGFSSCTSWTDISSCSFNAGNAGFMLYLNDITKPQITCPIASTDTVFVTDSLGYVYNFSAPIATDECIFDTAQQIAGLPSGATYPVGNTVNVFVASDSWGNVDTCSFTVVIWSTVGIQDNQMPELTISPNPTDGKITISADRSLAGYKLSMLSPEGKIVIDPQLIYSNTINLDISDYAVGMYFLKFESDQGVFYSKILKK